MSEKIRDMFSGIAGKYDAANDLLTFGMHRNWKDKLISLSDVKAHHKVLDLASGTGDIAFNFAQQTSSSDQVYALDFSDKMLENLRKRDLYREYPVKTIQGDVMNLPYDDDTFDITSISYGIRNVDDPKIGIKEMARVTKSGGKICVLETGKAEGTIGALNNIYSDHIMPVLGSAVTGDYKAYKYLTKSASDFPYGQEFINLMNQSAEFESIKMHKMFFGVSYIYIATVK